ncbi:MAG: hypothetical protein ACYSWQ_07090 [Planctomycetota bacterium]|jgi:hypothetical protein
MKIIFVTFGILLGGALGVLGSSLEILVWISRGRPEILIRRGWEDIHIVFMVVSGLVAGLIYGIILPQIVRPQAFKANAAFIFLLSLIAGVVLYTLAAFVSITLNRPWPSFSANLAVFLVSLAIAHFLSRRSRAI